MLFQKHMLRRHNSVRLFGCHFCFEAFTSVSALKSHVCSGFAQYLMNSLIRNVEVGAFEWPLSISLYFIFSASLFLYFFSCCYCFNFYFLLG